MNALPFVRDGGRLDGRAPLDVAGVGVGPPILSLAALLHGVPRVRARFFEARPELAWHPGPLLDFAAPSFSYLEDLVTPVDPTNPFSLLNYLVRERRLHNVIAGDRMRVPGRERDRYFQWACRRLPGLRFGVRIERLGLDEAGFVLHGEGVRCRATHLVLGAGRARELLDSLGGRVAREPDGGLVVNDDFSIVWDGPPGHRIYVHDADLGLASMALRSALVVNSVISRPMYDLSGDGATRAVHASPPQELVRL